MTFEEMAKNNVSEVKDYHELYNYLGINNDNYGGMKALESDGRLENVTPVSGTNIVDVIRERMHDPETLENLKFVEEEAGNEKPTELDFLEDWLSFCNVFYVKDTNEYYFERV